MSDDGLCWDKDQIGFSNEAIFYPRVNMWFAGCWFGVHMLKVEKHSETQEYIIYDLLIYKKIGQKIGSSL